MCAVSLALTGLSSIDLFGDNLDMIWHDAPSYQTIGLAVRLEKRIFDDRRAIRCSEGAIAKARD